MKAADKKHWVTIKKVGEDTYVATLYREGRKTPVHTTTRTTSGRALFAVMNGAGFDSKTWTWTDRRVSDTGLETLNIKKAA